MSDIKTPTPNLDRLVRNSVTNASQRDKQVSIDLSIPNLYRIMTALELLKRIGAAPQVKESATNIMGNRAYDHQITTLAKIIIDLDEQLEEYV